MCSNVCGYTRVVLRLVWPSLLLQSARDRVATAADTVTTSRLWSGMPVKLITFFKTFKKINWVTTKIRHIVGCMVPDIHAKFHNQPCAVQYGDVFGQTDRLTHTQLNLKL